MRHQGYATPSCEAYHGLLVYVLHMGFEGVTGSNFTGEYWAVNQILAKQLHTTDEGILNYTTNLMDKLEQVRCTRDSKLPMWHFKANGHSTDKIRPRDRRRHHRRSSRPGVRGAVCAGDIGPSGTSGEGKSGYTVCSISSFDSGAR